MKKLFFFFFVTLCCTATAFAQYTVSGVVVDAETKLPLEGASVFAQNTTAGTITNKEGAFKLSLSKGGYELMVTYTGYKNGQQNVEATTAQPLTIELQKEDKSMSEVIITSSAEVADGWEKYGNFFVHHFIGATQFADSTSILNPEVLKFYYYKRSNKLKVLATEPLQIANRALGYNLRYTLDSFVYYYKTDLNSYRGLCLYTQMEGDADQQLQWHQNRKLAYYGSRLHFLRSYFDSTLKEDGFTVALISEKNKSKFDQLANPYDTAYYFANDTTADVELWFPDVASITYTKRTPENAYLKQYKLPLDVGVQISYINLAEAIAIKPNGFFLDQRSWTNQGYWSWKNLADQLPFDYEP
jgi:hypothetical protein